MFIKLFMFIKLWNAIQLLASPRIIYILICWRTFIKYEGSQEERKTEKQFWVRDSLFMQTLHYCTHCSLEQVTKLAKALLSLQLLHGPEATLLSFTRWQWLEGICTSGRSEKEGRMGNHEVQTSVRSHCWSSPQPHALALPPNSQKRKLRNNKHSCLRTCDMEG